MVKFFLTGGENFDNIDELMVWDHVELVRYGHFQRL